MTKIDILDSYYTNLYTAIIRKNKNEIINLITVTNNQFPDIENEAERITANRLRQEYLASEGNTFLIDSVPWSSLSISQLIANATDYLWVMAIKLRQNYIHTFSMRAIQTLYYPQFPFTPTQILYENQRNKLTVPDLLSVTGYAIKILESFYPGLHTTQIEEALTVLKSIDLTLNNQPVNQPRNKALHITNDILTSYVKPTLARPGNRQAVNQLSLFLDLAIDFFCNK